MTSAGHYNARVGSDLSSRDGWLSPDTKTGRKGRREQRVDSLAAIKRLYFNATRTTIQRDVTKAIELLKNMKNDDERQDAAVYMDGLSQMRSEWAAARPSGSKRKPETTSPRGNTKATPSRTKS